MEHIMLTREEILSKEAGGELDELVAVKVMGFTISEMTNPDTCYVDWYEEGYGRVHRPFNPSSDISAAWEVFLKVDFDKEQSKVVHGSMDQWICYFDDVSSNACASAPLAICRAALLAVIKS